MNMNDAFLGSLIFNKNSGGGGGGEIPQNYGQMYEMVCSNTTFRVDAVNYTMEVVIE